MEGNQSVGWPKMAEMCRTYRDQWISHPSYPVGQENALKPLKSRWLIPAKIKSRYGRFQQGIGAEK